MFWCFCNLSTNSCSCSFAALILPLAKSLKYFSSLSGDTFLANLYASTISPCEALSTALFIFFVIESFALNPAANTALPSPLATAIAILAIAAATPNDAPTYPWTAALLNLLFFNCFVVLLLIPVSSLFSEVVLEGLLFNSSLLASVVL